MLGLQPTPVSGLHAAQAYERTPTYGLHPLAFNCSCAFRKKLKSKKSAVRTSFFTPAAR